jgi:hypothetical protein
MSVWNKLIGTQAGQFILGLTGVRLKNSSGNLVVRNNADSADADVTANEFKASGNTGLVINSDSAGTGADWKISVARPTAGMTADWTLTLPATAGSPTQVLQTDGSGNTVWVDSASGATDITDTTSFAFGSGSTVSMFTLPANAVILTTSVIVDTAFDGTPTLSVGIAGNASKYVGSGDSLLSLTDRFDVLNQNAAVGTSEALQLSYSAGGSTVGTGRVLVSYSIPA